MKKIAIMQSNYIPWKGYFDIIASVDEFIVYDEMQYTRRDWRNRNKIKTSQGLQWLTVPVVVKGKFLQKINDTQIESSNWATNHWRALCQNYRKASFFSEITLLLEPIYLCSEYKLLSNLNHDLISLICNYLEIDTLITQSSSYDLIDGKTERLLNLCIKARATEYVSGPSAKDYIQESLFLDSGIQLTFFNYHGYEPYPQLWGNFIHEVSIIDLLFNCGKNSRKFMKC
jgi:hypothetical protein